MNEEIDFRKTSFKYENYLSQLFVLFVRYDYAPGKSFTRLRIGFLRVRLRFQFRFQRHNGSKLTCKLIELSNGMLNI